MPKDKQSRNNGAAPGLADPTRLKPFKKKPKESTSGTTQPGEELLQVIIETPRGSRNKYSYDADDHIYRLKAALPAGMAFPYDFGFVPRTLGDDGDPLDVLVLMDEPAFPGCVLFVRLIGVMESEQIEDDKKTRNDRLIAVAETAHIYSNMQKIDDIPKQTRTEIEEFFSNYHKLQGKRSKVLAWENADIADKLIQQGLKKAKEA